MDRRFNTCKAADFLREIGTPFTAKTLEVWRCRGEGPEFVKIRSRIFYTEGALKAFSTGVPVKTADSL